MGCSSTKESPNEPPEQKEEENDEEEEKEETPEVTKKEYDFDKHTRNYFKNFEDEEIALILERKKSIFSDDFIFLYSKFSIDYTEKNKKNKNEFICKEYLACYVNPDYTGNFGYESQIIGFFPDKIILSYCAIQNNKIPTQMRNIGKIVSVLMIEDSYKDDVYKDIIVFEFVYNIVQFKKNGMRIINVSYDEKPMTSSILIKYNNSEFSIKSNDAPNEDSKNKFYLFDKEKFCLLLIDKDYDLSIKKDESKISKLIYSKFSKDEIKQINKALKKINIKPFEKNIVYEKLTHNLKKKTDFVKGYVLIYQFSFDKNFFELCEGIDKSPDKVDFLVHELKINDELLINVKKLDEKNRKKPENYYESTETFHKYNITCKDDFILFEFELEGINLEDEDSDEVQYSLDCRNIFNFFLEFGSEYKIEININNHEVYFQDDEKYQYKYNKTNEKIVFEGNWELKEWDNKKCKKYLPNEIIIKK